MEVVVSLAIGVLVASGVWLVLRPRTFQVLIGLSLLSYAVNLFIFSVGSLAIDMEPIAQAGRPADLLNYTDPIPQSLVLTAILFVVYYGFIVLVATNKPLLATRIGETMTLGIPMGVAIIVFAWVLTAAYVVWANRQYDPEVRRLRDQIR